MKIWTLVIDSDDGTTTEVFTDEALLDARALAVVADEWDEPNDGPMPQHWSVAYEHLHETSYPEFWITVTEHCLDVSTTGLSKRESFAAQAMAGLLSNHDHEGVATWRPAEAAGFAVRAADALIRALKSTNPYSKT